jgi:glycosyltransferase involved in cell wall biosynthesis
MGHSVCIVTPGHLASNPRAVKEADALHDAGYRVTVVAGDLTGFVRPFDEEIVARAPWTAVRVGPAPLRGRLASRLALAAVQAAHPRPDRLAPWLATTAYSSQTAALARAARTVRADLYIAHYVAALPAAAAAARLHGAVLGYDAEDFHVGEQANHELVRAIESAFLPRCSHFTAAAPMIADAYAALYGNRPLTVLNVFPWMEEGKSHVSVAGRPGGQDLRAYWFSQSVGPDRGLQSFLEAMARTRARVSLHIRGSDVWGHGKALLERARALRVDDRIELLPMASPFEMVELARFYDIGLSLETDVSESRRLCLTNKIFTYLLAGRPVLMSDTPAQKALASELGEAAALVSLSDPAGIAAQLDRWALSPESLRVASGTACWLARNRYNWQVERRIFLASVAEALERRGTKTGMTKTIHAYSAHGRP